MVSDSDHNFNSINPLHHVEGLSSVADRVVRKKRQQKKQQQKQKPKQQASAEPEDDMTDENQDKTVEEGHIDFRA